MFETLLFYLCSAPNLLQSSHKKISSLKSSNLVIGTYTLRNALGEGIILLPLHDRSISPAIILNSVVVDYKGQEGNEKEKEGNISMAEKELHSAPHSSMIEDEPDPSSTDYRFQAESIQNKINARNMELDKIQKDIFHLEADEATFKDVFEPMQKFCMTRHVEPLPKKRYSSLMGMRVTRDSVFMPKDDVTDKLGIERPVNAEDQNEPHEVPLKRRKSSVKPTKEVKNDLSTKTSATKTLNS